MKNIFVMATMALALGSLCFAQDSGSDRDQKPQVLVITNGPVVENVTDTTAQIAWSTNVSSSTIVHYGDDALQLNGAASMPWGALTHRVQLKNLKPNTMYYFRAESGQGQGTGTDVQAAESAFQTKPAPAQSDSNHEGTSRPPILYWPPFFAFAPPGFCIAAGTLLSHSVRRRRILSTCSKVTCADFFSGPST